MKRFATLFAFAALVTAGAACEKRANQVQSYTETGEMDRTRTAEEQGAGTAEGSSFAQDETQPVAGGTAARGGAPVSGGLAGSETLSGQVFIVEKDGARVAIDDDDVIKDIESKLSEAGLSPGAVDGKADAQLSGAISQFQAKRGLPMTGAIDEATASALGISWARLSMHGAASEAGSDLERGYDKSKSGLKSGWEETKGGVKEGVHDLDEATRDERQKVGGEVKELGSDVKEGGKAIGSDLEDGANEVGSDMQEGYDSLKKDLND